MRTTQINIRIGAGLLERLLADGVSSLPPTVLKIISFIITGFLLKYRLQYMYMRRKHAIPYLF